MPKHGHIRRGSLQYYPRKRADKVLPRVRWGSVSERKDKGILGFIGYKVGMASAFVRDNLASSLTKGQRITIPVTIIEFPKLKIFSVRFYKNNKVAKEVLNSNFEKELKKKVKLPKSSNEDKSKDIEKVEDYDDIRVIVYSQVKDTGLKKKPDMVEIGISGSLEEKLSFVKENLSKEISVKEFLEGVDLVDVRGVTKGKGFQGPTKRFGLKLRFHKSEKGRRGPGSGGPWHPARVEFTQPMAGQLGYFTRVINNNKIIFVEDIEGKDINPSKGFKKYGRVKNEYAIVSGSVQGPSKRPLLVTVANRPSKNQTKKNYEFLELR